MQATHGMYWRYDLSSVVILQRMGCHPSLWRVLNLTPYRKVKDESLFTITSRSPLMRCLYLNKNGHVTHSGLIHLASQCRGLDTVTLRGCWWVNSRSVAAFLVNCPVLRVLDVSDMVQITDVATESMGTDNYHHC